MQFDYKTRQLLTFNNFEQGIGGAYTVVGQFFITQPNLCHSNKQFSRNTAYVVNKTTNIQSYLSSRNI